VHAVGDGDRIEREPLKKLTFTVAVVSAVVGLSVALARSSRT